MRNSASAADRKMLRGLFGAPVAATQSWRPYDPRPYQKRCPNGHAKPYRDPDCGFCARKGKEE